MKAKDRDYRNWLNAEEDIPETTTTSVSTTGNQENIEDSKWYQITDSILGWADAGVDIFNDAKNGTNYYDKDGNLVSKPSGSGVSFGRESDNSQIFLIGGVAVVLGLVVYGIVKMNK